MNLPDSLVIGHYDVPIEDLGSVKVRGDYATYDPVTKTIHICSDMRDQVTAEKLMHEALHGIWDVSNLPTADEEAIITRLAPALLELFRFNPALKEVLFR